MIVCAEPGASGKSIAAHTIRKITLRIIPLIFVLYLVAFLDRINITFAALTMNEELMISSAQYGLLAGVFFIGYFIFEIPSNLLLHKLGARAWIARIIVTWGIVAALTGLAANVHQLYALRFALGVAEAGFAPGILLYLTYWFPRRDRARAIGLYLAGMPIATILGAPLSGLILDHAHWLGLSSWRWLLIVEGVPAIILGALTYVLLPGRPADARFLTAEERDWLCTKLAAEQQDALAQSERTVAAALRDGRLWLLVAVYFGILIGHSAFSFWAPQLIRAAAGRPSNTAIGVLVSIPSIVGLAAMIMISRHSDRALERRWHVAMPVMLAGAGLLLLSATSSIVPTMVLLCAIAIGIYGFFGPFWALPSDFLTGYSAAAGLALINSCGNLAGFAGPYTIGAVAQRTGSTSVGLALSGVSMLAAAALVLRLRERGAQR